MPLILMHRSIDPQGHRSARTGQFAEYLGNCMTSAETARTTVFDAVRPRPSVVGSVHTGGNANLSARPETRCCLEDRVEHKRNPIWRTLAVLVLFGVSFGYVEAAVVVYLGELYEPLALELQPERRPGDLFPLITREQLEATDSAHLRLLKIEVIREAATMVMLASVGLAVGWNFNTCVAGFVIAFGVWDIFYYVFLKALIDWPDLAARMGPAVSYPGSLGRSGSGTGASGDLHGRCRNAPAVA